MAQWTKGGVVFSTNQVIPANDIDRPSQQILDYRVGSQLGVSVTVVNGSVSPVNKFPVVCLRVSNDGVNWGIIDKRSTLAGVGVQSDIPFDNIPEGWSYVGLLYKAGDQPVTVTLAQGGFGIKYE